MTNPMPPVERARYIMIGGFLGAGKTTAVGRLALQLAGQGLRVGLITNDQGSELVDTTALRARGFATEEIAGGCFCCRFNSLLEAAEKLSSSARPDVFIAEPVGSCTDLVATVTYPLRRMYGERFSIAPLSVLVDPIRARRVLGLGEGGSFSKKVLYIYRKQLEEADLIVINKTDLLASEPRQALKEALAAAYPLAEVLEVSVRNGTGLEPWFGRLTRSQQTSRATMEVDYAIYADGEALLGWLNSTLRVTATSSFDGNAAVMSFANALQVRLSQRKIEVAHLKMTLSPDEGLGGLVAISLVRNDFVPELSQHLPDELEKGQLIVNLRAEADPETLLTAWREALADLAIRLPGVRCEVEHLEHFRPGKPQPTHRMVSLIE